MEVQSDIGVLICGAGASGLTLAIELARRGISFRIIDKLTSPFPGSRGKGIQPRTLEIFEDLGIIENILAAGGAYPLERQYKKDGSYKDVDIVETVQPTPADPFQCPYMVPQFLTEKAMRERLLELGTKVEFGHEIVGVDQKINHVIARIKKEDGSEENIKARYLIGTDGGRSFIRHQLEIDFPGKTLGVRALVADVKLSGLNREVWHRFNQGNMKSQISFCPLAGTDLFQVQAPIPLEGDVDLSPEGLNKIAAERVPGITVKIHSVSWSSAYTMNARLAKHYRIGNIFIVGDAAHIHPPTGGQGLNTSVQDAYNLGWKLAAVLKGAPDSLLETYEEERRPIAAEMLELATKLLSAMRQGLMKRGRDTHQLDLGYPDSSIALENPKRRNFLFHSRLRAGERAPDAPIKMKGKTVRLFELFRGTHWTLIGFEVGQRKVSARRGLNIHLFGYGEDLVDDQRLFQRFYEVRSGDWVLVRPDGYIGAIVSSKNLEQLEDYLRRLE